MFACGLLEPEDAAAGGELRRGVRGVDFGVEPGADLGPRWFLDISTRSSFCTEDGAWGAVPAAESALCMAAAEGTVGILAGPRAGLLSVLFFLDLVRGERTPTPGLDVMCGRFGEASLEGLGDDVAEVALETLKGVVEERFKTGEVVE